MTISTGKNSVSKPKKKRKMLRTSFDTEADQSRFDALVALSGLSQAEYLRRCCLDLPITVVSDHNLAIYSQLGVMQLQLTDLLEQTAATALTEHSEVIKTSLEEIKAVRLKLIGQQPESEANEETPEAQT